MPTLSVVHVTLYTVEVTQEKEDEHEDLAIDLVMNGNGVKVREDWYTKSALPITLTASAGESLLVGTTVTNLVADTGVADTAKDELGAVARRGIDLRALAALVAPLLVSRPRLSYSALAAGVDLEALAEHVAKRLVDGSNLVYSDLAEHVDLKELSEYMVQRLVERMRDNKDA